MCLAILISLFNVEGMFDLMLTFVMWICVFKERLELSTGVYDDGKSFKETQITKFDMRQRLIFLCKYAVNARPSRGNLKQVFNFLAGATYWDSDSCQSDKNCNFCLINVL